VEIFAAADWLGTTHWVCAIVEIEHGSDGVHAKAVDVVFVEPEEGVGD